MSDIGALLATIATGALVALAFWTARLARAASHIAHAARRFIKLLEGETK